jgi:peptidoglycan/xylan/chitin deacetylase (PgdA/CDA1 family)
MRRALSSLLLAALLVTLPVGARECAGTVYLTFDTGNMAQAEQIAAILKKEDVKATFFIANEKTVRGVDALDPAWGDFWRARVAEGHAFGNHTWPHLYLRHDMDGQKILAFSASGAESRLDRAAFCRNLTRVDAAFDQLTGHHLNGLWRAPGGRTTQQAILWAASCGFPLHVGWDDAGFLGDDLPSDRYPNTALLKRALERIRPGDVLMMHLGVWSRKEPLAGMLQPLIEGLKAKGYCFAPLAVAGH